MSTIKVAHIGDVHFSDKHLEEVDKVMNSTIDYLGDHPPQLIVIPGDTFDHKLEQNSPALFAAIEAVSRLANIAPTLIMQGTLSHDAPRAINIFNSIQAANEIYVVDTVCQVVLRNGVFGLLASTGSLDADVLISCLPSVNKGEIAAVFGADNAGRAAGVQVADLLKSWAPSHLAARGAGVPTIFMTHGTVSGSVTEHGCVMAGLDWEMTSGIVFASEASAGMINHIHKHQSWESQDGKRRIAYPGSLGRYHFGEQGDKGFLVWDVSHDSATFDFIVTPAKQLLEVTFTGTPDMEALAKVAREAPIGAHVRIRYSVDEEHRTSVDKEAIAKLFGAHRECKIEGSINPVQRQRSAGISKVVDLNTQLVQWAALTESNAAPLIDRLALAQSSSVDAILAAMA